MKTCKIHLIRSGISQANVDGLYCGSTNSPLSHRGELELGSILDTYSYPFVDFVYTSSIDSDRETASLLFPETEFESDDRLNGMDLGEFEGRSLYELEEDEDFQRFIAPTTDKVVPKGGEDPAHFTKRVMECVDEIITGCFSDGTSSVAIVASMGVISTILSSMGLPKASATDWTCDNGFGYTAIADQTLYFREPVIEVNAQIPVSTDNFERSFDDLVDDDSWMTDPSLDAWMKE